MFLIKLKCSCFLQEARIKVCLLSKKQLKILCIRFFELMMSQNPYNSTCYSSQSAVFMGCNKGEIELGFLDMSQVSNYI